jgi:hypothetical protein
VYFVRVRAKNASCVSASSADVAFVMSPPDIPWNVVLGAAPSMNMGACSAGLFWTGQEIHVDSTGAFHDIWSPSQPNVARIDGTLTPTTFSATLQCTNGAASGTLLATWNGSAYIGTTTFAGQVNPLRVQVGNRPSH